MLARLAADLLREDAAGIASCVLQLRVDVGARRAAITDSSLRPMRRLSSSSLPATVSKRQLVAVLHEGDGEWRGGAPDMGDDAAVGQGLEPGALAGHGDEAPALGCVFHVVARLDQRLTLRTEDGEHLRTIARARSGDQRLHGRGGRLEVRLAAGLLCRSGHRERDEPETRLPT